MIGPITSNDMAEAISGGIMAKRHGEARASCPYPPGPKLDAWLAAYDTTTADPEPLHKVLPNGEPLHRVPFGWSPS